MDLFIDSANLDEIRTAASWGIIFGVTTNPSLLAKEKRSLKDVIIEICKIVDGPISAEVMSLSCEKMVDEAEEIASWHKNIVIKIPCTFEGLKAVIRLRKKKIRVNVTLVFSANQILLAAKAGATYISPFVGRLDDSGVDGMAVIESGLRIINNYGFSSKIIVASVRSPEVVQKSAELGAHIATVPFKVLEEIIKHPLTEKGLAKFMADARAMDRFPDI